MDNWEKRSIRAGSAPVDLVLYDYDHRDHPEILSIPIQNNLLARTAQDTIREIHIDSDNSELLAAIVSFLTPSEEGTQEKCVESIILRTGELPNLSNFFAWSRLPKLQRLHLVGVIHTSVGIHLMSQTTRLTSLNLCNLWAPPPLSIPQLLSILLSNPNLRALSLADAMLPSDIDESEIRVPLRRLKTMTLCGEFHPVFSLLQRLELPAALNRMELIFNDPLVVEDISRTLGPYMQNRLRHDIGFREKLVVTCLSGLFVVSPRLEGTSETECTPEFTISINDEPSSDITLDLMAFVPYEHVVCLEMDHSLGMREELFTAMPNIEKLRLRKVSLSDGFLQPDPTGPHANVKLLPSLRVLCLRDVGADAGWRPLVDYLVHQTSNRQAISLELWGGYSNITPKVIKEVQGLVEVFHCPGIQGSDLSGDND